MKPELTVAVLGAGNMGRAHTEGYKALPYVQVALICDLDEEAARTLAKEVGASWCTDPEEIWKREDIQAVSICTPDRLHLEPTLAAVASGKAILLEKPLATQVEEAEQIVQAVREAGLFLLPGHVLRFDTRCYLARQSILEGKIGPIQSIYTRRSGRRFVARHLAGRVSLPFFLGVHDYDMMCWWTGANVASVTAQARYGSLKEEDGLPVADAWSALLRFDNGTLGTAEQNWILPQGYLGYDMRADIAGSRGSLHVSFQDQGLLWASDTGTMAVDTRWLPQVWGTLVGLYALEIRHFVHCALGWQEPAMTPEEALEAVRIAAAVEESGRTGQTVRLR